MTNSSNLFKGKVLIVDDSKVNLMLGEKILSNFGLDVTVAGDGEQAVDKCKCEQFQLILMDLEMPVLGGLEAAALIRKEKLSFAVIFALTGSDSESKKVRAACREVRMNGIIQKPIKKEKIATILNILFPQI